MTTQIAIVSVALVLAMWALVASAVELIHGLKEDLSR